MASRKTITSRRCFCGSPLLSNRTGGPVKARRILFDSWSASVANLTLIHRAGWTFFTTLKSNRLVSLDRARGYEHLHGLVFTEQTLVKELIVKLKERGRPCGWLPQTATLTGRAAVAVISNDLDDSVNRFVAELANDNRWQIEEFHRSVKQLTGSQQCQCRKARSPRNRLACCYQAWVALGVHARQLHETIYRVRTNLFSAYLKQALATPSVSAITL